MNASIYDIAAACGVSIATISRVLNNKGYVKKETRERVLKAIEESGYRPNVFARGMGLNSARMIGLLCTDVTDLYYARAVASIERLLKAEDYDVILCCTGSDPAKKKKYMRFLLDKKVDGILLIGSIFKEKKDNSHIQEAAAQVPVILINASLQAAGVYSVISDERDITCRMAESLVRSGCRSIHFLYDTDTFSAREKIRGFRKGIAACCAGGKAGQAVCGISRIHPDDMRSGRDRWPDQAMPGTADGILCANDLIAARVIKYLSGMGKRVPEDVRVIGYDDTVISEITTPSITSIDNRIEDLCAEGVSLLLKHFRGERPPMLTILPSRTVYRESFPDPGLSAPLPASKRREPDAKGGIGP